MLKKITNRSLLFLPDDFRPNTIARLAISTAINDIIIVETTTVFCVTKALVSMISVHEKKKN